MIQFLRERRCAVRFARLGVGWEFYRQVAASSAVMPL